MPFLYCDLETFSPTPINHGTHKYSELAEVMLFAYALEDGPIYVWDLTTGEPMPANLKAWLTDPNVKTVWHNGGNFDLVVLREALGIDIPLDRVHDTMIQAYQHSLPGALGMLCEIFGLTSDEAKDKDGKKLIQLFCKPRPKSMKLRRATRETHPKQWAQFVSYAGGDIRSMRIIHKKMPAWNCTPEELALWHLDQMINRAGVLVDLELAQGAIEAVELAQIELAERANDLTGGEVESATQRDKLLAYICESFGVTLPDMQAATLERRINDPDLPAPLRELLCVRLAATTSSTAKYKKLIQSVSSDGRLRGLLQFCGAARTGRWAGRIWQPQNLPRPTLTAELIHAAIEAFKRGSADLVLDDVMQAASSALRGCIIPSDGNKLVISDLSNIEGRVLAWLARETWKIEAFAAYDQGTGHDLYKLAYAKAFNIPPEDVDKMLRQIGKVLELSMGFGGGAGALAAMALAYGMDLDDLARQALPTIPAATLEEARDFLGWMTRKGSKPKALNDETFIAMESLKRLWRGAHPNVVTLWKAVEDAARSAINGTPTVTHGLSFQKVGAWLRIRLPSGRYLCYPSPKVNGKEISYMGVCPYTRKWKRLKTFGGKLVENIVQAIARDVLGHNMPHIMNAGYFIVLTVHDEVITEAPNTPRYNVTELSNLLAIQPKWAKGLPLAAAGFEADRYRKDD
jgi:DNA polymerase